jgi:hypothetical protein
MKYDLSVWMRLARALYSDEQITGISGLIHLWASDLMSFAFGKPIMYWTAEMLGARSAFVSLSFRKYLVFFSGILLLT